MTLISVRSSSKLSQSPCTIVQGLYSFSNAYNTVHVLMLCGMLQKERETNNWNFNQLLFNFCCPI